MAAPRKMSVRIRSGDVFEVPAPDGRLGYGQVIKDGSVIYVVIFRDLYGSQPDLLDILESDPLLVGWTVDSLMYHGRWKVVGNKPPILDRVPFPSYKVRVDGVECVRDFAGDTHRAATPKEWELLDEKTTVAPIRYQNALFAHHGLGEWKPYYDDLTVEYARHRVLE